MLRLKAPKRHFEDLWIDLSVCRGKRPSRRDKAHKSAFLRPKLAPLGPAVLTPQKRQNIIMWAFCGILPQDLKYRSFLWGPPGALSGAGQIFVCWNIWYISAVPSFCSTPLRGLSTKHQTWKRGIWDNSPGEMPFNRSVANDLALCKLAWNTVAFFMSETEDARETEQIRCKKWSLGGFLFETSANMFSCRFREKFSWALWKVHPETAPLQALCCFPFFTQLRIVQGETKAKRCWGKGRKGGGHQRGQQGKTMREKVDR